ncbi:DUF5702 domain-containing protein [Oribacterium sp. WCC10]|uniref:DUF5702 domain-containing protein n=1 Tax=Oribacterium sp. WCC10 TaxID=1855343 RepID=UPI0008E4E4EC|nr:DUF5702 domain-containing protein [Oribacterium sp. WCC10]SFG34009.1 hypothetical protein SAMN05216356_10638 [Oribacterium sp. WCC10]
MFHKETCGSVTVFMALSFTMIAALLLTIVESCRTVGERYYWQVAADSSIESLFSQFHRPLWENYRILGLQYRTDGDLIEEFYDFTEPYRSARNFYPGNLKEDNISLSEHLHITEDTCFEEEILEYMKYGLINSLISFAGSEHTEAEISEIMKTIFKRTDETKEIREIQKKYALDSNSLKAVENAISSVDSAAKNSKACHYDCWTALRNESPGDFYSKLSAFRNSLDTIDSAVETFSKAADDLKLKVDNLREDFESRKSNLSPEGVAAVEAEISEYENYVSGNGAVRAEIEAMPSQTEHLRVESDRLELEVEDFEEWLEDAIEDSEDDEDDDYDFSSEISAFYSSAASEWNSFPLVVYHGEVSTINNTNKRILDNISTFIDGNLLSMVLPDDAKTPSKSKDYTINPHFMADSTANPVEIAILGEYALKYFNYYHPGTPSNGELPPSGNHGLELEYLLGGKESDYKNLSEFVTRLVTLREGLNLIYLYTDSAKRNEARAFVTSFLCVTANPALISVFTFFVLGIWALAQSIKDVKTLLSGGRVPVFHDSGTWSMDIGGLLDFGQNRSIDADKTNKKGLSYRDYLRTFLLGAGMLDQPLINRRMLSRIEKNIQTIGKDPETGFSIDECLYSLAIGIEPDTRHVMFGNNIIPLVYGSSPEKNYSFQLSTYYKYRNDTH